MGHHIADPATAVAWAQVCNDLIFRVTTLFPDNFAGVCQLPQVAGEPLDAASKSSTAASPSSGSSAAT